MIVIGSHIYRRTRTSLSEPARMALMESRAFSRWHIRREGPKRWGCNNRAWGRYYRVCVCVCVERISPFQNRTPRFWPTPPLPAPRLTRARKFVAQCGRQENEWCRVAKFRAPRHSISPRIGKMTSSQLRVQSISQWRARHDIHVHRRPECFLAVTRTLLIPLVCLEPYSSRTLFVR
jgi:hypothetical protein